MSTFSILILAAGSSSRMRGADKLLQPVAGGVPLLRERTSAAISTGYKVYVALPKRDLAPGRWECLHGCEVECVDVGTTSQGMSHSLVTMVKAVPKTIKGALILPGDMPDITGQDMVEIFQAFGDGTRVVRGGSGQKAGHPVLFPRSWFAKLCDLSGDYGARDLLKNTDPLVVPLQGSRAHTDLDTPEEWAAWRAEKRCP